MILTKRSLIILGASAVIVLIFGQIVLLNAIQRTNTYRSIYSISADRDLLFNEPLDLFPIVIRYEPSTLYERTYYCIARFNNDTPDWILLQTTFNDEFASIEHFSTDILPLNSSKHYRGLAYNGSYFWTLESIFEIPRKHQLICFSLDQGIVSNRTLEPPDFSEYPNVIDFARIYIQIWNNILWVAEEGYNSSCYAVFSRISAYNLSSLEYINSSFFPVFFHEGLYIGEEVVWLKHGGNPLGEGSPPYTWSGWSDYGFSLHEGELVATIFSGEGYPRPSDSPISGHQISYQNRTIDVWYLNPVISDNKMIVPLSIYPGWSNDRYIKKFLGFRICSLVEDISHIIDLSFWSGSVLFFVGSMVIILYTFHKRQRNDFRSV